jgi:hypothetical protein
MADERPPQFGMLVIPVENSTFFYKRFLYQSSTRRAVSIPSTRKASLIWLNMGAAPKKNGMYQ